MPDSVLVLMPLMALVPMIPAYVLFKTLGSRAQVDGKEFYGFKVQLGGAFAGYFALVLLLYVIFRPYLTPPPTKLLYQLQGRILDENQRGIALKPENFAVMPNRPMIEANQNGNFIVWFIVDEDQGNGRSFPSIEVSYQDYLPSDLYLDPKQPLNTSKTLGLERDDAHHVIYVKQPISLARPDGAKGEVHFSEPQPISEPGDNTPNAPPQ